MTERYYLENDVDDEYNCYKDCENDEEARKWLAEAIPLIRKQIRPSGTCHANFKCEVLPKVLPRVLFDDKAERKRQAVDERLG